MSTYYTAPYGFKTSISQGWGGQFSPPSTLSGFEYDIPNTILYTIYPQEQYDVWLNVPTSIAQQLSIAGKQYSSQQGYPDPSVIYFDNIVGVYPKCILTEDGSPLLCDNGVYIVV